MKNSIWHEDKEGLCYIDYPNLEEFNKETRFVRKQKEEISLH
jgi:hypothetical protein